LGYFEKVHSGFGAYPLGSYTPGLPAYGPGYQSLSDYRVNGYDGYGAHGSNRGGPVGSQGSVDEAFLHDYSFGAFPDTSELESSRIPMPTGAGWKEPLSMMDY
jgi:hypothetical protein